MSEQAPAFEVPADVAYAAAEERAVRTTKALILAEAQVLTLTARVRELEQSGRDAAGRELTLRARVRELEQDEQGEVKHDATQDSPEGAAAGGEVGAAHPFHD
jgi:hypothetical protein